MLYSQKLEDFALMLIPPNHYLAEQLDLVYLLEGGKR